MPYIDKNVLSNHIGRARMPAWRRQVDVFEDVFGVGIPTRRRLTSRPHRNGVTSIGREAQEFRRGQPVAVGLKNFPRHAARTGRDECFVMLLVSPTAEAAL